jgi:hypothetical protein
LVTWRRFATHANVLFAGQWTRLQRIGAEGCRYSQRQVAGAMRKRQRRHAWRGGEIASTEVRTGNQPPTPMSLPLVLA